MGDRKMMNCAIVNLIIICVMRPEESAFAMFHAQYLSK